MRRKGGQRMMTVPDKVWYKRRTVWLAALTIALAALASPDVLAVIPLAWLPLATALAAVLGIVVRSVGSEPGPVADNSPPTPVIPPTWRPPTTPTGGGAA